MLRMFQMTDEYRQIPFVEGRRIYDRVTVAFKAAQRAGFSPEANDCFGSACLQAYDENIVLVTGGFLD